MIRVLSITLFLLFSMTILGQSIEQSGVEELIELTEKFQLTQAQQVQVKQLIIKKQKDLNSLADNKSLDELQSNHKRSSIVKGFEGSMSLVLTESQVLTNQNISAEKRKEKIALIERLKKEGYSKEEILNQLNKSKI